MWHTLASTPSGGGDHSSHGWPFAIFGAVMFLIGLLHAAKPDATWKMQRWQFKNRGAMEPSAAGLTAIRIGGIIGMVAGVVVIVIGLT